MAAEAPKSAEAGAPERTITPDMVRAGVVELFRGTMGESEEDRVIRIFRAMDSASRRE